ncbi:MAG: tripartite tricarboxylate transporter substrate binding protein [Xanthobacteraceae bacterium]
MLRFAIILVAALIVEVGVAQRAFAQAFPSRTVKFILPFGPASGTDIVARLVGDRLSKRWNQPVVIENRPGGDGLVSINAFTAASDDHTLLWVPVGVFAVHPFEREKLPYDADRDLLPIVGVTSLALAMSAPESLKTPTLRDFIALAKASPGKLNAAAASGNADFLLGYFLRSMNLDIAKVPYRDIMQGPNDIAEGRIQLLSSSLAIVTPLAQAGKIRILAVTSKQRMPSIPDVPTVREAGYPTLEMDSPGGIFGPRGMPLAVRERIAQDVRAELAADPTIAKRLEATGQVVTGQTPAEFAAGIKQLRDQLAAIAKLLDMKATK